MRKINKIFWLVLAGAVLAGATEMPICEEFNDEPNITCVATDRQAVIITTHADGSKSYEFFKDGRKIYLETDYKGIYAQSPSRKLELAQIPSENTDSYVSEVLFGLLDDIEF